MRSVLFHLKEYRVKVTGLATRPVLIKPEPLDTQKQHEYDLILAFITVEIGDDIEKCSASLAKEIIKFCKDVKTEKITIAPFAHLSNKLADSDTSLKFFDKLKNILVTEKYNVIRTHFGSDKELMIDLYGHPGNVRYREF